MNNQDAVVLFSGGRDSSLAACILAKSGYKVHLLSTANGASVKSDIAKYRIEELNSIFPNSFVPHKVISSFSLFRRIALQNIEEDFAKYKYNLIPLGDAIATHTIGILYCIQNNVNILASGYVSYENTYPEQFPEVVELTNIFAGEYGIEYKTPVFEYDSLDKVKYRLFDFGVSTKSLEGMSLFADTYSTPPVNIAKEYFESKLEICREFIEFMR